MALFIFNLTGQIETSNPRRHPLFPLQGVSSRDPLTPSIGIKQTNKIQILIYLTLLHNEKKEEAVCRIVMRILSSSSSLSGKRGKHFRQSPLFDVKVLQPPNLPVCVCVAGTLFRSKIEFMQIDFNFIDYIFKRLFKSKDASLTTAFCVQYQRCYWIDFGHLILLCLTFLLT